MDALVKNWIELSLISGCKLAGDIFQDMQPSASVVLYCNQLSHVADIIV